MTYRNSLGDLCIGDRVPGEGEGVGCLPDGGYFDRGPVDLHVGARQMEGARDLSRWDHVWVWGLADVALVRTMEVELTNCRRIPIHLDRAGVFLRVFGVSSLANNIAPRRILAYDQDGDLAEARDVPLPAPPGAGYAREGGASGGSHPKCD